MAPSQTNPPQGYGPVGRTAAMGDGATAGAKARWGGEKRAKIAKGETKEGKEATRLG